MAEITPEQMANRMEEFRRNVSHSAMSAACAAALRVARRKARSSNYGFTDRTGETRKGIGPVRRYKASTARRKGGGGAYFRITFPVGAVLEYRYAGKYRYVLPALRSTISQRFAVFTRTANREIDKEARKLARRPF